VILFLGSSSLIKLYTEEPYSDIVREWVEQAEIVATCRVAYTEIVSAVDSRFKAGDMSRRDYELLTNGFTEDWVNLVVVDFDELETGRLIKKYGLRRLDAMHLSAAELIKNQNDVSLYFSSFEKTLCKAAAAEGLRVLQHLISTEQEEHEGILEPSKI
jgi:predicted nucleic acid-binding protein